MTTEDCVFCKISKCEIPGEFLYRDETCFAIRDINPVSEIHFLLIPVSHTLYMSDILESNFDIFSHMYIVARNLAISEGISESGYRIVLNQKDDAGQEVPHLHLHVLGGNKLGSMV